MSHREREKRERKRTSWLDKGHLADLSMMRANISRGRLRWVAISDTDYA